MSDLIKAVRDAGDARKSRRAFLKRAGTAAGAATLLVAGCDSGDVRNDVPRINIVVEPQMPSVGQAVTLTAQGSDPDGQIVLYIWRFPDGTEATGQTVEHTFPEPGVYDVTLIVEDSEGLRTSTVAQVTVTGPDEEVVTIDLSTDVGVLNYAYALEQLEAAFYETALDQAVLDGKAQAYIEDIAAHEAIHRDFFAAAIPAVGGEAIPELAFDFSSVNFLSENAVLGTAQVLEDTGVAAYNGAASLLSTELYLKLAGKIVSVEARHAAAVRALVSGNPIAFANLEDIERGSIPPAGLGAALPPDAIFEAVGGTGFLSTNVALTGL